MTREEKVDFLKYLRALEDAIHREAAYWKSKNEKFPEQLTRIYETQAAEIHALAELLEDEIRKTEIPDSEQKG